MESDRRVLTLQTFCQTGYEHSNHRWFWLPLQQVIEKMFPYPSVLIDFAAPSSCPLAADGGCQARRRPKLLVLRSAPDNSIAYYSNPTFISVIVLIRAIGKRLGRCSAVHRKKLPCEPLCRDKGLDKAKWLFFIGRDDMQRSLASYTPLCGPHEKTKK